MESSINCLNCNSEIRVGNSFCSNCGQKVNLTRIRLKDLGRDFVSSFINYEGPFWITFMNLFYNPKKPIGEFLKGKRKTYYPPVKYLLVCLALSVLVTEFFDYDPIEVQMRGEGRSMSTVDSNWVKTGHFLHQHINYFVFLFPFSFGIVTTLFYWRKKLVFAERLVAGFYLAGQFLIINSILIPIIVYFPSVFNLSTYTIIIFLSYAFFNFFQPRNKWLGSIQAIVSASITFLVYVSLSFFLAYFIIKHKS